MNFAELEVVTKIKKIDNKKVQVTVSLGEEKLDSFTVDTTSMFDVMIAAKNCISTCISKLKKYK